ncbi:hypothetical protein ZIOFF_058907 [Zingiber officinale]|uniref:Uncharacterized protein n=1 Tax=Zingiber officinale TaxID=94328 RepID=A0A8J5F6V7_ZINOF|nr:hypothetical protein ZIOFF_058907 [Zingiber officinale]
MDNKKDYAIEYDKILDVAPVSSSADSPDHIEMVAVESFVSTQGWESETVVDYRHDALFLPFLTRFSLWLFNKQMYVTPPDMDVYSIPKVLAPMPQKYIRCAKSNFGSYNVTEPPIDAPRDPLYKTEREIMKKPENLSIAMNMAMTLERKQCFHQGGGLLHTNWGGTTTKLNTSSGGPPLAKTRTLDISKEIPPVSFFKRLTRAEMAERSAKGLCFNCDESYSTGHKCKRLFWIEVSDDEKEGEERGK